MALSDPNVQITYPNVSLGAQLGTYATMTWNDLVIKNNTGAIVATYNLSSNLTVDVVGLEYVSARDQLSTFDGATFFSLQHYSDTRAVIRRWEINNSSQSLDLKNTIIKDSVAAYKYNCQAFAVEHHERSVAVSTSSDNKLRINSLSRISSGDKLLLGPSTDTDNPGETELMTVDYTYTDGGGNKWVVFTADFNYEYVAGDPITFYKYIYTFTNDHTVDGRGAIYRLHPETGAPSESNQGIVFQDVSAAAWSNFYGMPVIARYNHLFYINHLLGYVVYRSHNCWQNIEDDLYTVTPIVDLVIDDNEINRLQNKITLQDGSGNPSTTTWSEYNFHDDTALQYSCTLGIWGDGYTEIERRLLKKNETVALEARLKSQYGFPLVGYTVYFSSDDVSGEFNPITGQAVTDNQGFARVTYNTGISPAQTINITAYTTGGDGNFGDDPNSDRVFAELKLFTVSDIEYETPKIKQISTTYSMQAYMIKQVSSTFSHNNTSNFGHIKQIVNVRNPQIGSNKKTIKQLQSFQSSKPIQTWFASGDGGGLGYPLVYPRTEGGAELDPPFLRFRQIEEFNSTMRFSQLYQAHHEADMLSTTEGIDQFFFVIEAVPPWYSEKNPTVQTIYLRISPFAFDLQQSTFHILVRNTWTRGTTNYDTGWSDVTSECTITPFGSPLGLTIYYNPAPNTWEYDSRVWVRFYVYDSDPSGNNLMDVTYWFDIIPDYRGPEIINHYPERYASNVEVDTNIRFDVVDYGAGVDPDALEVSIEGVLVEPWTATTISGGYRFEHNPSTDFYYGQEVSITIDAYDLNGNNTHQTYYFTVGESSGPWYHGAYPLKCAEGVVHDSEIMLQLYAIDHGINTTTILVKVDRENREFIMYPIVYRLS